MHKYGLYICWVISCLGTLGSLYFSEIEHFAPCQLCWYQRVTLYPLVILLVIAAWRAFFTIIPFVLPLVVIGLCLSIYQVFVEQFASFRFVNLCGSGPSCATKATIGDSFLTIPMLATLLFLALFILLIWTWKCRTSNV